MDAFFDDLIGIQQAAISSFRRWRRVFLVGGIAILMLSVVGWIMAAARLIDSNLVPSVVTLLGLIISAASFLQYKEIAPRQIAIRQLQLLKQESAKIRNLPEDEQQERLKKLSVWLKELPGST